MKPYLLLLPLAVALCWTAFAQTTIPAAGLCNTGLTTSSPLPAGCTTSRLVSPVNPESGGSSVDGNWQLATPYPSASASNEAPDPCLLSKFGPAWIDTGYYGWLSGDGASQWITPESSGPNAAGGWYIYRTPVPVPAATTGYAYYYLTVEGRETTDDFTQGIFLGYGEYCRLLAMPAPQGDAFWSPFKFATAVLPETQPYLYFVVYNTTYTENSFTGVRVEFTSAYFTPFN